MWAWLDEGAGVVRERVFAAEYGIAEDEATGAAAVAALRPAGPRARHPPGPGSRILARRRSANGMVEIGGRVELDEVRAYRQ